MMELASYHELTHHANIYSLSVFEGSDSCGCVVSTSRGLYQVACQENTVRMNKLNFSKIASAV